ncbi:type II secretion system protein [Candidatus Gracilibacteria bacterium 28_42_T64]|nr:type II secretion system protein [Candidatus Gracilibacteria bacterium 28_42_T64]
MRNTKQAFTLVELIVVITILAILGTIAFISLQGYSADARNSKRVNDLGNLADSVNIKSTQGSSLLSFVTSDTNTTLTNASVAGTGTLAANYSAGFPNYIALGVKEEDFKDPNGPEYRVAATTNKNGQFEFASSIENGAGLDTAKIIGNYNNRGVAAGDTATITSSGTLSVTLADTDIGKIVRGDTVTAGGTAAIVVTKVSSDGTTLTLNAAHGVGTGVLLSAAESTSIIASTTGVTTPIEADTETVPY